jgi:hypothetical protein
MEPKLEQQFVQYFENFIRQIVKDEYQLLLNSLVSYEVTIAQTNYSKDFIQTTISSKIGWLKGENTLLLFHNLLIAHGFISCDFEAFKIHFVGNIGTIEYIQWYSQTTRLVYLLDQLMGKKIIPETDTPHQLLKENFINNKGKRLCNRTLRSTLNNVRNNSKSTTIIDTIITELIKNRT